MPISRTFLLLVLAVPACAPKADTDASARTKSTAATTTISGRLVISQDGGAAALPAPSASVYLEGAGDASTPSTSAGTFSVTIPDAAAGEGASALSDDAVGWYAMHDTGGGKFGVEQPNVLIRRGEANDLGDVVLTKTARITGKVELEGAASHAGATVAIPRTIFTATTDAAGNFTIEAVPASVWALQASMPGFESRNVEGITTESDATEDVGTMTMTKSP